jgi:hypothetical protein
MPWEGVPARALLRQVPQDHGFTAAGRHRRPVWEEKDALDIPAPGEQQGWPILSRLCVPQPEPAIQGKRIK